MWFKFLIGTLLPIVFSSQALAGAVVSYHGRILKPDGSPLEGASVAFKIQVRSPGVPNCLLYEEMRSLNMLGSNGIFVIPIGDGNGARTGADPGITIENVFSNNTALNFTSLTCNSGNSYSPSLLDSRRLVVSFDDASGAGVQTLASMDINYVPLALHAYEAQSALKVGATPAANVMTVSGPASALTPSNFTELLALVNGTSTTYAKTSSAVGGDLSGTIASANVVKLQGRAVSSSAPSTNDVLTWNGTSWAPAAGGGGGAVSSVAGRTGAVTLANTDISGLGDSATKNVGTTAGTVAAGDDARFGTASTFTGSFTGDMTGTQSATVVSAVGGSTATNVHNAELLANSATSANTVSTIVRRDANGDFTSRDVSLRSTIFKDSGSKTVTVLSPTALTNSYTLTWPLDKGTLNQVLTTDASGNLFWSTPAGGGGGGTVTSVTSGGAPIVVTGTPADPVISVSAASTLASGVVTLAADGTNVASTVVQATDSRLTNARAPDGSAGGDLGSTYPNPTVNGIKGAAITYTSLTTGDVLKYNGSAWINTALSTANLSDSSDLLKVSNMPPNCSAGSSLTFSSPSGTWVCTTIPAGTTSTAGIVQLATSGSATAGRVVEATDSRLTDARAPAGNAGGDLSSTYPNPTVSKISGVGLSYTSLTSGDYLTYNGSNWVNATLPAGASYWTAATGGINYAGGNVGIGTAAPAVSLDLGNKTDAIRLPNGTDAERPGTPGGGMLRYNTTATPNDKLEYYDTESAGWVQLSGGGSGDFKADGTVPMSGVLRIISGTSGTPGLAFGADLNTGIFRLNEDQLTVATGGSQRLLIGSSRIYTNNVTLEGKVDGVGITAGLKTSNFQTAAVGNGSSVAFYISDSGGAQNAAASIVAATENATQATFASSLRFSTKLNNTASERMRIDENGYVGIGTTAPRGALDVSSGTIVGRAPSSTAVTTIDFGTGNLQFSSLSCQAFVLNNMKSGGSYALAIQGTSAATCSFTAYSDVATTALTVHLPPDHTATIGSTHTLYNFMVMGTHVYVSWVPGY